MILLSKIYIICLEVTIFEGIERPQLKFHKNPMLAMISEPCSAAISYGPFRLCYILIVGLNCELFI